MDERFAGFAGRRRNGSWLILSDGTLLSIRNELLTALSLPSAASAVISLIALTGGIDSTAGKIVPAVIVLMILYGFVLNRPLSPIKRQAVLAGILIGSQVVTRFVIAMKPSLESEFRELLNGEILAVSSGDLIVVIAISAVALAVLVARFSAIRLYAIDEDSLRRFTHLRYLPTLFRGIVISLVTVGVVTIGPLLTTALIILPALLADTGKNGFCSAVVRSAIIAIIGIGVGFPLALACNFPPAYMTAFLLIPVGFAVRLIK